MKNLDDIIPFLKLYRSAKAAGMSVEHVVNLLRIANDDNVNNTNNDREVNLLERIL
jgi:hypothetical protein